MKFEVDIEKVEEDINEFKNEVASVGTRSVNKEFTVFLHTLVKNVVNSNEVLIKRFSDMILEIIRQVSFIKLYHSSYRIEIVKVLIRLCNKNIVSSIEAFESLLPLVTCEDKELRRVVLNFIINELKKKNNKSNPVELNKKSKSLLQKFIKEHIGKHANFAAKIFVLLFIKNIWTDQFSLNVIADCCLHDSAKVKVTALKFFLNKTAKLKDETDSESDTETSKVEKVRKLKLAHRVGKKSKARQKHLDKELNNIKKKCKKKKSNIDNLSLECNVLAIQQLRDPQVFTEALFGKVKKAPIHIRMLMLELISRLIGYHKLQLVNFYSYIIGFLNPRTADVTNLLVFAAQASHEFVSPDDIQPVIKMIADQFANEGISGQGIALGLNSIREICVRCPHAMPEDLLALLLDFINHRDKNVISAARSLLRLYREINPSVLPKSLRGKPTEAMVDADVQGDPCRLPAAFGELNSVSFIPGAEIIMKDEDKEDIMDEEYESCSDISDEDEYEDWVDIQHSSESDNQDPKELRNPEERRKLAEELSYHHIFTDEEHLAIKKHVIKKKEMGASKNKKRSVDNEVEIDSDTGEIIDPTVPSEFVTERIITKMSKKLKATREEKMESIKEGRIDRAKFGFNVNRFNPNSSTTNREKAKKKNYMMVSFKKKAKQQKLSLKQKNKLLQEHILKRAKFMRS